MIYLDNTHVDLPSLLKVLLGICALVPTFKLYIPRQVNQHNKTFTKSFIVYNLDRYFISRNDKSLESNIT